MNFQHHYVGFRLASLISAENHYKNIASISEFRIAAVEFLPTLLYCKTIHLDF